MRPLYQAGKDLLGVNLLPLLSLLLSLTDSVTYVKSISPVSRLGTSVPLQAWEVTTRYIIRPRKKRSHYTRIRLMDHLMMVQFGYWFSLVMVTLSHFTM